MKKKIVLGSLAVAALLAAAVFITGMVVQHRADGSDSYAGCGTGAPDWAQQSAEACTTFEAQSNQQQYDQQERERARQQEWLRERQAEERARQQQQKDNLNCQVGPMFCPR